MKITIEIKNMYKNEQDNLVYLIEMKFNLIHEESILTIFKESILVQLDFLIDSFSGFELQKEKKNVKKK